MSYSCIEDLKNSVISPLNNDDFYFDGFDILYKGIPRHFSHCYDYELNNQQYSQNEYIMNISYKLMKLKVSIFRKSIEYMTEDELQRYLSKLRSKNAPKGTKKQLIDYLNKILDMNFSTWKKTLQEDRIFFQTYEKLIDSDFLHQGLCFINSRFVSPKRKDLITTTNTRHCLYISINYSEQINFLCTLISALENEDLPYKIKYETNINSKHNDNITIYVDSDENLVKYINIINEIISKHPEYKRNIHIPSSYLFSIGKKIGYGFVLPKNSESYSSVIGPILDDAINYACREIAKSIIELDEEKTDFGYKSEYKNLGIDNCHNLIRSKLEKERKKGKSRLHLEIFEILVRDKVIEEMKSKYNIDLDNILSVQNKKSY